MVCPACVLAAVSPWVAGSSGLIAFLTCQGRRDKKGPKTVEVADESHPPGNTDPLIANDVKSTGEPCLKGSLETSTLTECNPNELDRTLEGDHEKSKNRQSES